MTPAERRVWTAYGLLIGLAKMKIEFIKISQKSKDVFREAGLETVGSVLDLMLLHTDIFLFRTRSLPNWSLWEMRDWLRCAYEGSNFSTLAGGEKVPRDEIISILQESKKPNN